MIPRTESELQILSSMPSTSVDSGNIPIRQSRNLPHWLWVAIAKSIGIKFSENEKPIISTIFYIFTYSSCLGMIITTIWFNVYDIISDYTRTTVVDGSVNIIYTIMWAALGVYAKKLSYRLFNHPHFMKLVKLHSKTIFKMNAAVLLFLLMTLFIIVNNINAYKSFESSVCKTVGLEIIVCKFQYVFRVLFSVFALLWNYLVGFATTSVCRSHVIRIRKFMKILEQDSREYEKKFLGLNVVRNNAPLEEYSWVEENYLDELHEVEETDMYHPRRETTTVNERAHDEEHSPEGVTIEDNPETTRKRTVSPSLSNDEILFNYWKIQSDLRVSCVALQRWMVSVISLVAIWLTMNMVLWLSHDPSSIDLVNFFLPLLLLPLLSSPYAEVNQEGQRLLKFICLSENRLQLLLVLQSSPLQMSLYNYTLSYKTIGTAAFGVLLAMASKILLQKFMKVK